MSDGPRGEVRPVREVVDAVETHEGAGFPVRRPFARVDLAVTDPFLLLDEMGPVDYAPGEAKGAPDHPHRGFETVTYMLDGAIEHRDSTGGGGVIGPGDTQWMTAGAGLVHSEMPVAAMLRNGGRMHGVQLWVNLPRAAKLTQPRYQHIARAQVTVVEEGGAVLRVIAGRVGGHEGPGRTHSPITYAHATLAPGARLDVPWDRDFNALVYALSGSGAVAGAPTRAGQLAVLGPGDRVVVETETDSRGALDLLLLGGHPIREPIAWYGPFVMSTRQEILEAIEDYEAGRLGRIAPESA